MKRSKSAKPKSRRRSSATIPATKVVKQGPSNVIAALAYEMGKNDYRLFKPRPPTPTNGNCDEPKAMQFYGWMMARADDVMHIIDGLKALKLSEKKHNALMSKRVDALDRAHSPDGRDHGPIW